MSPATLLIVGLWLGVSDSFPMFKFSSEEPVEVDPTPVPPVIFIPGKGGSQLEARFDRDPETLSNPRCPHTVASWERIWLDVWQFLWPGQLECWSDNIRLHYNETLSKSAMVPGVEMRVPGFGDTTTVEYIDDSWMAYLVGNMGSYFRNMLVQMTEWGYRRGETIRGAPYDFRFAPHNQHEYFHRMRELVEDTYNRNNESKVTLMSHSMGGIYTLYFLHTMPQQWKDQYVRAFVPVNAPWKGTVLVSNLYTSGYNWGITPLNQKVMRTMQRTWETGVMLLPQPDAWGPTDVLVQTPDRNYTAYDYGDYFRDMGHVIGKKMYDNIRHESYDLGHPGVDTYCVYSYGTDTPDRLVYEPGEFPNGLPHMEMGPGDGTVNLRSLDHCSTWASSQRAHNHTVTVKTFKGVDHIGLMYHEDFVQYFKDILEVPT